MIQSVRFHLRNFAQVIFGPVAVHRFRRLLQPRANTENGSCSYSEQWVYIYPTFGCTLKCSYCQNLHATGIHNPVERGPMDPRTWAVSLNRLGRHVVISGGDPFVYPHLAELVNGIDKALKVVICSDLSAARTLETVAEFGRAVAFDVTYHPCSGKSGRFLETVLQIRAMRDFDVTVHSVGSNKSLPFLRRTQKGFLTKDVRLKITPAYADLNYPGSKKVERQTVLCSKRNINIGPDGWRYPCLTKAIRMQDPICHVSDERVGGEYLEHVCHDYGHCVPCDLEEFGMKIEILALDPGKAHFSAGQK